MTIEELQVVIKAQTDGLRKELDKVNTSLNKMNNNVTNSTNKMNKSLNGVAKVAANLAKSLAAIGVIKIGVEGVSELNQAQTALNSLNRTLGEETTDALQDWSENVAYNFGLGRAEALKTSMFMASILKGFIDPSDTAQATQQLIGQMAVLAKSTGKSMDVITESIQSAFLGSFERVENIIPTMTRSLANQYAQTYYNVDAFAKLNQEQQKFVMYQMIMAESMSLYGNSLTPAMVSMLQLQATLQDLKLQFGAAFATILDVVMPVIQAIANGLTWLVAIIAGVADAIASLFGKSKNSAKDLVNQISAVKPAAGASTGMLDSVANALGVASNNSSGLANGLSDAEKNAKKLQGSLMGFDEINTLNQDTGDVGSLGSIEVPEINMPSLGGVAIDLGAISSGLDTNFEKFNAFSAELEKIKEKAKTAFETVARAIQAAMPYVTGIALAIAGIFTLSTLGSFLGKWDDFMFMASDDIVELAAKGGILDGIVGGWKKSIEGAKGAFSGFFMAVQNELAFVGMGFTNLMAQIPGLSGVAAAAAGGSVGSMALIGAAVIAVIAAIVGAFVYLWNTSDSFRNSWIEVWENIKSLCMSIWDNVLKPIFDAIVIALNIIWEGGLKPLWEAWCEIWEQISGILTDFLNFFIPIITAIVDFLGPFIKPVLTALAVAFGTMVNLILVPLQTFFQFVGDIFGAVRTIFQGFMEFLTGVFTGNWTKALEGLSNIFGGVFQGLKALFTAPFNFIINGINAFIRTLNKIQIPDWVPGVGGLGFNFPEIPRLARGGIVDSGQMFMAGEAGKEAIVPLEHNLGWAKNIGQIVAKEMGGGQLGQGSNQPIEVTLQIGTTKLGRVVIDSINKVQSQEGRVLLNI